MPVHLSVGQGTPGKVAGGDGNGSIAPGEVRAFAGGGRNLKLRSPEFLNLEAVPMTAAVNYFGAGGLQAQDGPAQVHPLGQTESEVEPAEDVGLYFALENLVALRSD